MKIEDINRLLQGEQKLEYITELKQKIKILIDDKIPKKVTITCLNETLKNVTSYEIKRKIISSTLVEAELANTKEILTKALIEFEKL